MVSSRLLFWDRRLAAWRRKTSSWSKLAPLVTGLDDSPTETLELPTVSGSNNKAKLKCICMIHSPLIKCPHGSQTCRISIFIPSISCTSLYGTCNSMQKLFSLDFLPQSNTAMSPLISLTNFPQTTDSITDTYNLVTSLFMQFTPRDQNQCIYLPL